MSTKRHRLPAQVGSPLTVHDLPEYVWNGDLIEFDGPLLSLYRLPDQHKDALFLLLDRDHVAERWCICEVSRTQLHEYLNRKLPLRRILENASSTIFFDVTDRGRRRAARVLWKEFPTSYRPSDNSFLTEEIATETAKKLAQEKLVLFDIRLSGDDLFIEDLSQISRSYQQLYSFHYGLWHLDRVAVRERVVQLMTRWTSGLSAVNLFTGLRNVIPSVHRPRVANLHYASPGHIRLEVLPKMSEEIAKVVNQAADPMIELKLESLYKDCYHYFKVEKLAGFEDADHRISENLTPEQAEQISSFVADYFDLFKWATYRSSFANLEATPIQQLRAVLAYHRRLRHLVRYAQSGQVKLPL